MFHKWFQMRRIDINDSFSLFTQIHLLWCWQQWKQVCYQSWMRMTMAHFRWWSQLTVGIFIQGLNNTTSGTVHISVFVLFYLCVCTRACAHVPHVWRFLGRLEEGIRSSEAGVTNGLYGCLELNLGPLEEHSHLTSPWGFYWDFEKL